MQKIYQTDTSDKTGNCHQAAVASLFGFPLSEIPNFIATGDWRKSFYDFMRARNIGVVIIPIVNAEALRLFCELNPELECYCLLAVRSFKHETKGHCVVAQYADGRFAVVHDPNPENADIPSDAYEIWSVDLFFKIESTAREHDGEITFRKNISPERLRKISHRDFEQEYLGEDTREKLKSSHGRGEYLEQDPAVKEVRELAEQDERAGFSSITDKLDAERNAEKCRYCGGTGEICHSSTHYSNCPECGGTGIANLSDASDNP